MTDSSREHQTFLKALQQVLRVSPAELKERIQKEKKARKRKTKTSASGRVAGGKG